MSDYEAREAEAIELRHKVNNKRECDICEREYIEIDMNECDCGYTVCDDCREQCENCGNFGCKHCLEEFELVYVCGDECRNDLVDKLIKAGVR